jgi:flagellar hook-length control protein FliK
MLIDTTAPRNGGPAPAAIAEAFSLMAFAHAPAPIIVPASATIPSGLAAGDPDLETVLAEAARDIDMVGGDPAVTEAAAESAIIEASQDLTSSLPGAAPVPSSLIATAAAAIGDAGVEAALFQTGGGDAEVSPPALFSFNAAQGSLGRIPGEGAYPSAEPDVGETAITQETLRNQQSAGPLTNAAVLAASPSIDVSREPAGAPKLTAAMNGIKVPDAPPPSALPENLLSVPATTTAPRPAAASHTFDQSAQARPRIDAKSADAIRFSDVSAGQSAMRSDAQVIGYPHPLAPSAASEYIGSAVTPTRMGDAAAVPLSGVAIEIATRAVDGDRRFEIRLDPPELGRIDVRLDMARDGTVSSRLIVERAETLDLLRRDAGNLERALQTAGLNTNGSGLEFSLRDGSGNPRAAPERLVRADLLIIPDEDVAVTEAVRRAYGVLRGLGRDVDIRI